MSKEKFEDRKLDGTVNVTCKFEDKTVRVWSANKQTVVAQIVHIVNEYAKQGYVLTLRQLHYQMVTQNWIVNHQSAYAKLSGILDDCRYAGIIDWNAIEDRGRVPYLPYWVNDPKHAMEDTIEQYRIDRQDGQQNVVELWTEKDALSGILTRTTSKYHIQLVVNKGYTSSSAIYGAYKRVKKALDSGKKFTILYFGDHDPSGLDMVRDIEDRLMLFLTKGDKSEVFREAVDKWFNQFGYGIIDVFQGGYISLKSVRRIDAGPSHSCYDDAVDEYHAAMYRFYIEKNELFQVIPIGLTMEQIKKYKLPPNPAKMTDSRADEYIKRYGKICWEVDALKPNILTEIVEKNIQAKIDIPLFNKKLKEEESGVKQLKKVLKQFN